MEKEINVVKQYFIINEDNSYGGSVSNRVDGINYTEFPINKPTDIWDGEKWIDNTPLEEKIQKAIAIDLDYTKRISDLLAKPIERLNCDGIPISQSKLDERDALRTECNTKITALGITDFTYRQSVPKLSK